MSKELRIGAKLDMSQDFTCHECGPIYEMRCPKCHDRVRVATGQWWDEVCSCGIQWTLETDAVGVRYDR